jgi:isocitrate/isopropylmalate dehydrogenase
METATDVSITTYAATLRCVRFAFELARTRGHRVTLAHKTKVLTASGAVWTRATRTVADEYPDVTLESENVDILCARLVGEPDRYDVIVTDNVFGDIVSDVACAATRSADHSGSAELTVLSAGPSLFEPIHGTGQPGAPLKACAAAAMMLRHLGETTAADALAQGTLAVAAEHGTASAGAELVERVATAAGDLMKETI